MNLEIPKKFASVISQATQVANEVFRPISRKYDRTEHKYPVELNMLASILEGMSDGAESASSTGKAQTAELKNGAMMSTVLTLIELCKGDLGLTLSLPRQGLGNTLIAALATEHQLKRFGKLWVAMAITEAHAGSDCFTLQTTATEHPDHFSISGEKTFVTAGSRCDAIIIWARIEKDGQIYYKPFLVERDTPGLSITHLENKLGARVSDTATLKLEHCNIPKSHLLGESITDTANDLSTSQNEFDATRPAVAAMALGVSAAALGQIKTYFEAANGSLDYKKELTQLRHIEAQWYKMEAEWEAARLLTLKAAWLADNGLTNAMEAAMAKSKAGKLAVDITLTCCELASTIGYSEQSLLEKWARDVKMLDFLGGTQQMAQLLLARQLLDKTA
ncbi:MAG: acyl-CoA dehydrogenase family protein, partial [Pseudomonadales bacterium]|nr:acyl-CoA dehydrogenase family protein [Pseudomonadales bacterium]